MATFAPMGILRRVTVLSCLLFAVLAGYAFGLEVDNSVFAQLLHKHLVNGLVDYQGFKADESVLDNYLRQLAEVDTGELADTEAFSFYVNAYNAWTIKLILTNYPGIKSIKSIGGLFKNPWKLEIAEINGDLVTLDDIEHGILRPRFGDPRVHFAVNCASKSCPPLRYEPYTGRRLDMQLDESTEEFINDPEKNYVDGDTLYVSKIFKWYAEDFKDGVIDFVAQYAAGALKQQIESLKDSLKVKYLDYDWSLNASG